MSVLYIVSTPIGNLGDMSARAIETLKQADYIAAEDTRVTAKLKNAFGIDTPQLSYFEHSDAKKTAHILSLLSEGKTIALVSDAGTPLISDPGCELVSLAVERGIEVISIPGPCAAIAALTLSAFDLSRFCFEGFLPRGGEERKTRLQEIQERTFPSVIYESPFRLKDTLKELSDILNNRRISVSRELTKLHEHTVRGTATEALNSFLGEVKGEVVIVVDGAPFCAEEVSDDQIIETAHKFLAEGESKKSAIFKTALFLSVNKNRVYKLLMKD